MAAFAKHGLFTNTKQFPLTINVSVWNYATKAEKKRGIDRKLGPRIDSSAQSLAAKGFLRPQKAYSPSENVDKKIRTIVEDFVGIKGDNFRLDDLNQKFKIFNSCYVEFQHGIPNSLLHEINTIGDVINFYSTEVSTVTPYNNFKNSELPSNLHVLYEYHRFHPETDTMFDGITAYPRSSTIVSGLKYKNKYKGHEQRENWPFKT